MKIDWEHIYLLGWHSVNGRLNLTSWTGKLPWVDVVIVGATDFDMPHLMWTGKLHKQFIMMPVPHGVNPLWYAAQNDGLRAFGWYIEEGIKRPAPSPLVDEWDWFNKLRGK